MVQSLNIYKTIKMQVYIIFKHIENETYNVTEL